MKIMKKFFPFLAFLTLTASLIFSGCKATSTSDESITSSQKETLPPVKLIWYFLFNPQPDQEEVFAEANKIIKREINAEVEFRPVDHGNYNQKLQAVVAAGDYFDLMWTSDWKGVKLADAAQKGLIAPIDELLSKYAPKTKAFIEDAFWDQIRIDGKLYGVPSYQLFAHQNGMWIKKDLLEKYNFDINSFKKYTDLEPFFDAILAGEENVTPLAAREQYMWWFHKSFGPYPYNGSDIILLNQAGLSVREDDQTKIISTFEEDQNYYIDTMKAARNWYNKGYVKPNFFTNKSLDQEIAAQQYAAGFGTMQVDGSESHKEKYGFEVDWLRLSDPKLSAVAASVHSISSSSNHPERAMMFIELLNNDVKLYNLLCNGIEFKHYTITSEGRLSRVENSGYNPKTDWVFGNVTNAYLSISKPLDYAEQIRKLNHEARPPLMTDFIVKKDNIQNEYSLIGAIYSETFKPLVSGVIDPENKYPDFLNQIKKAGLDKVRKEAQKQLDEYWKRKK